jgi:hypothetical protein
MLRAWQGCCECGIVGRVRNATSHVAVHPRGIDATEPRYTQSFVAQHYYIQIILLSIKNYSKIIADVRFNWFEFLHLVLSLARARARGTRGAHPTGRNR